MHALRNNTWTLAPRPKSSNVAGPNGCVSHKIPLFIDQLKGHLVAKVSLFLVWIILSDL